MANSRQPGTLPSQPLPNPNNVLTQKHVMNPNSGHAHLIYQAPAAPSPDGMEASTSYAGFQQQPPLLPNPNQNQAGLNSVTTRSGKTTQDPHYPNHSKPDNHDPRIVIQDTTVPDPQPGPILEEPTKIPFPEALTKGKKTTKPVAPEEDLVKLFEQVHINIPLMDAIRHVPAYA